jgi:hypothetical protein
MVLRGDADGVGWIVTGDLGRVWFDLDKCRDPDSREIDPWAGAWLTKPDLRGAYMEISPSGRGIHVLGKVVSWTEPRQTRIDVTRLLATLDEQELEARWGGSRKCHPLAAIEIFHACVRYVTVTGWMMEIVREAAP